MAVQRVHEGLVDELLQEDDPVLQAELGEESILEFVRD